MKISLIGPVFPYRGGIAHYTAILALSLENKHQLQTISFLRQYPGWLYPGRSDKDPSQNPIQVPAKFILDPIFPWTWAQALNSIRIFRPNLVITQWWTTFWALPFAYLNARLKKMGIKTAYLVHNVMPHESRPWDRWLAKQALSKANHFIVQTQSEVRQLSELVSNANIHSCYIPPFFKLAENVISSEVARRKLNIPLHERIFLFFGFVRPYKGLEFLLQAFKELQNRDKNNRLLITGEFWGDKSSYLTKIEAYGLSESVTIIDKYIPNEQLPVVFGAPDCLVVPYKGGTQSAVASTGLAFGLPLIVTERIAKSISSEFMSKIKVTSSQDINELVEAMASIKRRDLFEPATPIRDKFSWDQMVKIVGEIGIQ